MTRLPRKWLLVCGALLACASPAAAQGLDFGVKGGVNVANVDVSGDEDGPSFDPRIGLVAGGFVRMPLTSWLAVQGEGLYAEKGARFADTGVDAKLLLTYLEVPVLARIRLSRLFYATAGPSMGFLLQAKARTRFSGATEDIDVSDDVQSFDFGIAMGGGVELGRLILDGRYTLGLRDADKDETDTSTMKNRTLSFTAGFRF
jgi:hypothetical protein